MIKIRFETRSKIYRPKTGPPSGWKRSWEAGFPPGAGSAGEGVGAVYKYLTKGLLVSVFVFVLVC